MITRVRHLRAKRDIGTCLVGQVLKRNFIGGHRNINRWWQHRSGRPCDKVGKAKWAKEPALVALDHGRDGRIGCIWLGRGKEALDVGNLLDDISEVACVDGILGGNDGRDTTLCMTEVDWKRGCVQGTKLSNLVSRVDNHFGLLNEGKTKDCVYDDVWANRNKESGWSALAREVR
jgi:hypothetical protein